uniref:Phospholipase B1, membrane-associated n=1 Tax=Glossina pallidipes TaxID=7398 RepID=A0A1A9Z5W9_GLOPL
MWWTNHAKGFALYSIIFLFNIRYGIECQRTWIDDRFGPLLRELRVLLRHAIDPASDNAHKMNLLKQRGKLQEKTRYPLLSNCDTKNGPGARSVQVPNSVHRLRPGDIDIIGAMGDSLTAGNGILATTILQVSTENRGKSWSGGGEGNLQQFLTLPNILKEFNPNLYGYSLKDSLTIERDSKFNVAEPGAMSRDMPYMAKILVKRMKHDPRVNMTHHWKMITLFIGSNDLCSDVCSYSNPMDAIDFHEANMLKTFRYLRENVPRLLLNVVPALNLSLLTEFKNLPPPCYTSLTVACPCIIKRSKEHNRFMDQLIKRWQKRDLQIAARDEFNGETFTIIAHNFFENLTYPTLSNGDTDLRYASEDCFHISQRFQAHGASLFWNNMFKSVEDKQPLSVEVFDQLSCPTKEHPYLVTRLNSEIDFSV